MASELKAHSPLLLLKIDDPRVWCKVVGALEGIIMPGKMRAELDYRDRADNSAVLARLRDLKSKFKEKQP